MLLQQNDAVPRLIETATFIGAVLLPLIGICVVLFSIFAFVRPSNSLKDKTQRIRGFGLDLEVSVLTLFILIGLTFSMAGIYLVTREYEKKIEDLAGAKDDLKRAEIDFAHALRQARQIDVTAYVTLDGSNDQGVPRPEQLECNLFLFGSQSPRRLSVGPGIQERQYQILIENLSQAVPIRLLTCQDTLTRRAWKLDQFNPLEPEYRLQKQ
jgi:hypothetical protein